MQQADNYHSAIPGGAAPVAWPPHAQPDSRLREVEALLRAGNVAGAATRASAILKSGFEHPWLMVVLANYCMQRGEAEQALSLLEKARKLGPEDADTANMRGVALKRLGFLEEARTAFNAAIAASPELVKAYYNLGGVCEALGDREAARAAYEYAIGLEPQFVAVLVRLAQLAALRGDYDAACQLGDLATAADPAGISAAVRLSEFATSRGDYAAAMKLGEAAVARNQRVPGAVHALANAEIQTGDLASARRRLEAQLNDPSDAAQLSELQRAHALSLVADIDHREGQFDAAFAGYTQSKALIRSHYAPQFAALGMKTYAECVEDVTNYFVSAPPDPWIRRRGNSPVQMPARDHVFVLGFARSGTTLLEQVLAGHPDIETMDEIDALSDAIKAYTRSAQSLDALARATEEELAAHRETYWRSALAAVPALRNKIFVDKMPFNSTLLCVVTKLFPHAKILFTVRDPRDVVFSCLRTRFGINAAMYEFCSLESSAAAYDSVMRLMDLYRDRLDLGMMDVRYEELVGDFDAAVDRICRYLGIARDPAMRDVRSRAREKRISTPSGAQLARGLYNGSAQWRPYARHLEPVMPILQPWVERYGYSAG